MVPDVIVRRRLTYEDYLALPDDQDYEIIDGVLYVSPRPQIGHQVIANRLAVALSVQLEKTGLGTVVPDADLIIDDRNTYVSPDLMFFWAQRFREVDPNGPSTVLPDLVIEILSPSTDQYDLITKQRTYARLGIQHYWIADPVRKIILEHTVPVDDAYTVVRPHGPGGEFRPSLSIGLTIDVGKVFQ